MSVRSMWCAAVLMMLGSHAAAQTRIEVGPLIGYYRPTTSYDPTPVYSTDLPSRPKELAGTAWGVEARLWFNRRLGVQIQGSATGSTRSTIFTPGGPLDPPPAQVITAAVQLLYAVAPQWDKADTWLSLGPAVVHHGGEAYEQHGSPTDLAGVAGIGGSLALTKALQLTAGVAALLYSFDVEMPAELRANGETLQQGFQTDALLHLGMNWTWTRR